MPTITINRKAVEELAGKKLPVEELKDRISMMGTDLESVDDKEIIVEIFPNRPDMLSEQGFARAFSSFIGVHTGLKEYKVKKSDAKIYVDAAVRDIRPYTAAAIVKGVKFTDELVREIMQNQEKLHMTFGRNRKQVAMGYYILDKIRFPVKYTAKKPKDIIFEPLEMPRKMDGIQILRQHPAGRDYAYHLEGKDRFPVHYDADMSVLSMPPIINSNDSGKITPGVSDVFIECTGMDQRLLNLALNMAVCSLADMGGKIYSVEIIYPGMAVTTPVLKPSRIKIDTGYINRLLGLQLKEGEIKKCLEKMGYGYERGKNTNKKTGKSAHENIHITRNIHNSCKNSHGTVLVPAYRADILHQADIAEDIAIAYGYENFSPEIPKVATTGQESKFEAFKNKIAYMLTGLGMIEANTYHLTSRENQNRKMDAETILIEIQNPSSREYSVLRSWLIPSLLEVIDANKRHDYPQNIFDMGTVFMKDRKSLTDTGVLEKTRLGVVLCGKESDFTKIKQVFDYLMRMLGLDYELADAEHPSFVPGRVGRGIVKKGSSEEKAAYIGEIHPKVLEKWQLEMPVAALELNLTDIFRLFNP